MRFCPNCGFNLESLLKKTVEDTSSVPETPQRGSSEVTRTESGIEIDYMGENKDVAVPKVSDYRERYKKHQLKPKDVKTNTKVVPLQRMDKELDAFGDLIFGDGVEQEF